MFISTVINSKQNQYIKLCREILERGRAVDGVICAQGDKVIQTMLGRFQPMMFMVKHGVEALPDYLHGYPDLVRYVSPSLMRDISDVSSSTGVVALLQVPNLSSKLPDVSNIHRLLVLDGIQDPGNMGTLCRSAVCSGWNTVISTVGTTSIYSPKAIRSSAGAIAHLDAYTDVRADELHECLGGGQFTLLSTLLGSNDATDGDIRGFRFTAEQRLCLVLGSEGSGMRPELADYTPSANICLPVLRPELDSLNVGVAGSILMYRINGLV